ncbi:MAG: hypothetical protein H7Z12_17890 [Rhodospirillaceae bacterium]|nr:hypothetical protein [Rhodospirillales bacterium]
MWTTSNTHGKSELVCYVFHHSSGLVVDRSEIVVSDCGYAQEPKQEIDANGVSAWFLFRSIPIRLCRHAGECEQCSYALGEVTFSNVQQVAWQKRRAS